jgi:hypothetical protein
MIHIKYTVEGETKEVQFPNNRKGNSDSVKFLQKLADEQKKHAWYFRLAKIEDIEAKLKDYRLGRKTKKRFNLEVELKFQKQERKEHLEICEVTAPPGLMKIEVTHD